MSASCKAFSPLPFFLIKMSSNDTLQIPLKLPFRFPNIRHDIPLAFSLAMAHYFRTNSDLTFYETNKLYFGLVHCSWLESSERNLSGAGAIWSPTKSLGLHSVVETITPKLSIKSSCWTMQIVAKVTYILVRMLHGVNFKYLIHVAHIVVYHYERLNRCSRMFLRKHNCFIPFACRNSSKNGQNISERTSWPSRYDAFSIYPYGTLECGLENNMSTYTVLQKTQIGLSTILIHHINLHDAVARPQTDKLLHH